jgi:hypothetical protein
MYQISRSFIRNILIQCQALFEMEKSSLMKVILISVITFSCLPQEPMYYVSYLVSNNSNHSVRLEVYLVNNETDAFLIPILKTDTIIQGSQEDFVRNPPPFFADSVLVIYDDSVSIMHYRKEVQIASRNILSDQNWSEIKIGENIYEFQYEFTDADYLEAVENQ